MVPAIEAILTEFREEVPAIRRILERVPQEQLGWKPHPKSRTLGELAVHIANLPGMIEKIATADEFAPGIGAPAPTPSAEEIRGNFEKNVRSAEAALSNISEQTALGSWRMVFKGKEILRKPRIAAFRTNVLNHLYHHRGQLSVYLRLLDISVPSVYGPTADENPFA